MCVKEYWRSTMTLSALNLKYFSPVAMHTGGFSPRRFKRKYKNMDSNEIGKIIIKRTTVKCR